MQQDAASAIIFVDKEQFRFASKETPEPNALSLLGIDQANDKFSSLQHDLAIYVFGL